MGYNLGGQRKFKNRSSFCQSKHWHQSILEADYCNELLLLKKARKIKDFSTQHKIEIVVNGQHICNHYVDFLVTVKKGKVEYHEVKGYEQEVWKLKRRLVVALYPDVPYIVKRATPRWWDRAWRT